MVTKAERKANASKGGKTRAERLTKRVLVEQARKGALARWGDENTPRAVAGDEGKPLKIGGVEIPCYVLNDGRRVFTTGGLQAAIGLSTGGGKNGTRKVPALVAKLKERSNDLAELTKRANTPFLFIPRGGGGTALGYEATFLADLCTAVLAARAAGLLTQHQARVAAQCEILMRGFSCVGIIAVVDEHTGYQEIRARDALARSLDAYIAKELQRWVRVFPPVFYREMFRLRGWVFDEKTNARPPLVGKLTNDLVYSRLAPGVLEELQQKNPKAERGYRLAKHHQWFNPDIGSPMLHKHIVKVTSYMECCETWDQFMATLDRLMPVRDILSLQAESDAAAASSEAAGAVL